MSRFLARHGAVRRLSVVGLALVVACTTWRPFALDSPEPSATRLPFGLRATKVDGSRYLLLAPFVRHDSLFGRWGRDTLALALRDVSRLERERFSVLRTAGVLLVVPATLGVLYLIQCRNNGCSAQYGI